MSFFSIASFYRQKPIEETSYKNYYYTKECDLDVSVQILSELCVHMTLEPGLDKSPLVETLTPL